MRLQLLPAAKDDVLDAFEAHVTGLGQRFEDDLFTSFERIKSSPEVFSVNSSGF